MSRTTNRKQGFTLIEIMLAMTFVAILIITISLITTHLGSLYNKGLTLKEVNQVSRIIVRDMQQSISGADQFKLQYLDKSHSDEGEPKTPTTLQEASDNGVDYYTNDAGGRLCTGVFTYIWNTGNAAAKAAPSLLGGTGDTTYKNPDNTSAPTSGYPIQFVTHKNTDGSTKQVAVRFMKVRDTSKTFCHMPAPVDGHPSDADAQLGDDEQFANVFGTGNNDLMLYNMAITNPLPLDNTQEESAITAVSTFYSIRLTIGTHMGDESGSFTIDDPSCEAPSKAAMNSSEYCAVNIISFVARTGRVAK